MKYKAIAENFTREIMGGHLQAGERLPSLRILSKQHDVSVTTALNCYRLLEETGWIETQARSGFYVSQRSIDESLPSQPQFIARVKTIPTRFKFNEFETSSPLDLSQLSPQVLPVKALQRSIKRTVNRSQALLHSYANPQGHIELREALSSHFSRQGFSFSVDDLFISAGCMAAIRTALLVTTQPGDCVAISSPCFGGLLALLSSLNRKVIEVPCTEQGIDVKQLERLFSEHTVAAALLTSSFMNPNGMSLSVNQKQRLAFLANAYKVPIIEDDVYGELGFEAIFPLPIKHWDTNGYVLWCGSVSKSLASGLRIGWCNAGRYLAECVQTIKSEGLSQNGLLQLCLADFIRSGQYQTNLGKAKRYLLKNCFDYRDLLVEFLPEGSAISAPRGGTVLWLQVPGLNLQKLKTACREHQIDIQFGSQFTSRNFYRNCLRLNMGWSLTESYSDAESVEQVLLRLCKLVNQSSVN